MAFGKGIKMNEVNLGNEGFTKEELEAIRNWFGI